MVQTQDAMTMSQLAVCFSEVANSEDPPNDIYIDIIVEATPDLIDPIDVVQEEFNNLNLVIENSSIQYSKPQLLRIIDILGREVTIQKGCTTFLHLRQWPR